MFKRIKKQIRKEKEKRKEKENGERKEKKIIHNLQAREYNLLELV